VHTYRICGLSVASEIVLPGVIAGEPDSIPQITIRCGAVPEALLEATAAGPTWQSAGEKFLLRVPKVARFLLTNGEQIVFAPESDSGASDVPIFILGTMFGILLHQREQIVLHASAVEVNGSAVLFCGPSGAGKSTLAAALVQRGYRLLTDDLCAITLPLAGAPIVHPDGRQLKLWAEAIDKLKLEEARGERVRPCLEKFYVEPRDAMTEPLPLGAIYALGEARHFRGQGSCHFTQQFSFWLGMAPWRFVQKSHLWRRAAANLPAGARRNPRIEPAAAALFSNSELVNVDAAAANTA
jgi:hypothetical protein